MNRPPVIQEASANAVVASSDSSALLPTSDWLRIWCNRRAQHLPPALAREIQLSTTDLCARSWVYFGPPGLIPSAVTSFALLPLDRPFSRVWLACQMLDFILIIGTAIYVRQRRSRQPITPALLNSLMVVPVISSAVLWGVFPIGLADNVVQFNLAAGLVGIYCFVGFFWTLGHWPISVAWAITILGAITAVFHVLEHEAAWFMTLATPGLALILISMSFIVTVGLVESRYHLAMARDGQELIGLLLRDYERGGHDFLWETDAQLNLTHVPPRMLAAGHGDPNITEGGSLIEALQPDAEAVTAVGQHRPFQAQVPVRGLDGVGEIRLWGHPKIISGEYLGYRGVGSDEFAAQRAANAETISERLDAIVTVTAGLAHDFNNQLATVLGAIELVHLDPHLSESSRRHADRAVDAVLRSRRLTTDLVVAAGHDATYQAVAFDVGVVINTVVADVATLFPDVSIEVACAPAVHINSDPSHFERALRNLIQNACQAFASASGPTAQSPANCSSANSPTVIVESRSIIDGRLGPTSEIIVTDNGPGIPAEVIDRVFEPFVSTRRHAGGTGLGLAVARGFAAQANGSLRLLPTIHGTSFAMHLPLTNKNPVIERPAVLSPPIARAGGTSIRGHIVVVDDDTHLAENLQTTISTLGGTAEVVTSVQAARARFARSVADIDCVISDLVLPDGDGFEVVDSLRKRAPNARAVYMSGFSRSLPSQAQHHLRCPFVAKPFSTAELLQALYNAGVGVTYDSNTQDDRSTSRPQ